MKHLFNLKYIFIASLLIIFSSCVEKPFYQPTKKVYRTPEAYKLKYEEIVFKSEDGTELSGWFMPAEGKAKGTVIQFHGNAQNMTSHFIFGAWLPKYNYNFFVFDYRGYGKSKGTPSRDGIYQDSVAALEYVINRKGIDNDKIIVLGQSLGGAKAIAVLGNKHYPQVKGLIIDSAFASYKKVASDALRHTSVSSIATPASSVFVSDKYQPLKAIKEIKNIPKVFIHGTHDPVVQYKHGVALFNAAQQPKQFLTLKGAGHVEAFSKYARVVIPKIYPILNKWVE